jgi:outer membrane murein-binding lipoprotein Lpp
MSRFNRWLDEKFSGDDVTISNNVRINRVDGDVTTLNTLVGTLTNNVVADTTAITASVDLVDGAVTDLAAVVEALTQEVVSLKRSRRLVGYAKLMFDSDNTFYDLETPFNLTASYVDSKTLLVSFVQYAPASGDYIADFGSGNLDLDYRNGTEGQYLYSSDLTTGSFKMNLFGKQFGENQAFVIKVYGDSVDPV